MELLYVRLLITSLISFQLAYSVRKPNLCPLAVGRKCTKRVCWGIAVVLLFSNQNSSPRRQDEYGFCTMPKIKWKPCWFLWCLLLCAFMLFVCMTNCVVKQLDQMTVNPPRAVQPTNPANMAFFSSLNLAWRSNYRLNLADRYPFGVIFCKILHIILSGVCSDY